MRNMPKKTFTSEQIIGKSVPNAPKNAATDAAGSQNQETSALSDAPVPDGQTDLQNKHKASEK